MIETAILPMMDKLLADEIPNIRFNVAKSYAVLIDVLARLPAEGSLHSIEQQQASNGSGGERNGLAPSPHGHELVQSHILPGLEKLQQDDDVDVRYFATVAAHGAHAGK